ncbi:cytochrome c maturation protein CcmE [Thermopetrobacter sp. TC1]|uniref:cytochrome c maturation protein CcmE n=1 Tax=Thermopetrobacter sp. TC1 TaxID=1495045 RepID=UPI0005703EE6|nr:cytochrome c maturation protein CcmE [Thermopetrobacter sp. TC1]
MTRKQQRLILILSAMAFLSLAVGLILYALRDTIVFFYTPTEMAEKNVQPGTRLRLGGLVEKGSFRQGENGIIHFAVTDTNKSVKVTYKGVLPDLFREGQGVVAEGVLQPDGTFKADTVLAKHDEKYMPREVADSLKKQGLWKHAKDYGEYGADGAKAGKELTQ